MPVKLKMQKLPSLTSVFYKIYLHSLQMVYTCLLLMLFAVVISLLAQTDHLLTWQDP